MNVAIFLPSITCLALFLHDGKCDRRDEHDDADVDGDIICQRADCQPPEVGASFRPPSRVPLTLPTPEGGGFLIHGPASRSHQQEMRQHRTLPPGPPKLRAPEAFFYPVRACPALPYKVYTKRRIPSFRLSLWLKRPCAGSYCRARRFSMPVAAS